MKKIDKSQLKLMSIICLAAMLFGTDFAFAQDSQKNEIPVPKIDGDWWTIATNPDIGEYNSPHQQPVDFGIWQAADGTWQLWSCIRNSRFPGTNYTTRFLYGWEGNSLTSVNWEPKGIKWVAEPLLGETPGGMQAPYVFRENNIYNLFYGDWKRICLATSTDGKNFTRVLGGNGQPNLFSEEHKNVAHSTFNSSHARDPMVLKIGNTYYCYYTSHMESVNDGWAYCRTSLNLKDWSESVVVSHTPPFKGNSPSSSDECPFVVYLQEYGVYYLFVTQIYGKDSQTTVYASTNPMYFGIDDDHNIICTLPVAAPEILKYQGQWYIASTTPDLQKISLAKLKWETK
ncbi:hypothetical protein GM418_27205 [Maribellus comscasis]|uniref:Glycosyl hydrolase family 32 N-terminal domain-containing protein n=1 Tax=Maribellus comscasis TaxID=2681766 RepID=A0A6I6K1A4_9BACT|nr:hypothetical protein [Maribellus comscasis]QGY47218.1 hypothetical protein GM418_27205 [Maribellus comscasis]